MYLNVDCFNNTYTAKIGQDEDKKIIIPDATSTVVLNTL